jgi:hypothetical protein
MMKLILLLVMIGVVAALVGAVKVFGWWAVLVIPVVGLVLAKLVLGRLVKRLFMMPFKAKGAVLRGARAQVHGVSPTSAPVGEDGETLEDAASRDFYEVEATITPAADTKGSFQLWEPGELRLVPPGYKPEDDSSDDAVEIAKLEIQQDGAWQPEEGMKYPGPQRLRLTAGVKRGGPRQLRFQYYFEMFGTVSLPAVLSAKARPVAASPSPRA